VHGEIPPAGGVVIHSESISSQAALSWKSYERKRSHSQGRVDRVAAIGKYACASETHRRVAAGHQASVGEHRSTAARTKIDTIV
jgi:hypothetical protein